MKDKFLSVCITSYNRVNELRRCLNSIKTRYSDEVEIIVSEDNSPQRDAIADMVKQFAGESSIDVIFNTNEVNQGYDRNLGRLKSLASGKYIFYLSDDDCIMDGALDKVIDALKEQEPALMFEPFYYGPVDAVKRKYNKSFRIDAGEEAASTYLYDAILFSGLIFEKDKIAEYDAERFLNCNYFQVYMFLMTIKKYGAYYLDVMTIDSVSDGENAYGTVKSTKKNELLADRNSIYSNIEFNKGLIKVIRFFDEDSNSDVITKFAKEYSMRSYGGLSRARAYGRAEFKNYWKKLNELDIPISGTAKTYYATLLIFGNKVCDVIYGIPKKLLLMRRSNKQ